MAIHLRSFSNSRISGPFHFGKFLRHPRKSLFLEPEFVPRSSPGCPFFPWTSEKQSFALKVWPEREKNPGPNPGKPEKNTSRRKIWLKSAIQMIDRFSDFEDQCLCYRGIATDLRQIAIFDMRKTHLHETPGSRSAVSGGREASGVGLERSALPYMPLLSPCKLKSYRAHPEAPFEPTPSKSLTLILS